MSNNIKYWRGEEELNRDARFLASQKNEFNESLPLDEVLSEDGFEMNSNRRDFLKYFGFSVTAVTLAACYKTNVRHAVPYLVKPEEVTPGVANYYRSTCGACSVGCGIEVKVREGRPIKVDGSRDSAISGGGLCAMGQASILSLYDTERLANPLHLGAESKDWSELDASIKAKLDSISTSGKGIAIVSGTVHSPSTLKSIADFTAAYPGTKHVMYDAVSYSGMLDANLADFGTRAIPSYDFSKANVIVSFAADFLGTWVSPVEFAKAYGAKRRPDAEGGMNQHFQFESALSMTGTNADHRFPMKMSEERVYLSSLYNYMAQKAGATQMPVVKQGELAGNALKSAAEALWNAKGSSLVISGSNDKVCQQLVNAINALLGNYGSTLNMAQYSKQHQGSDADLEAVKKGLNDKTIGAVIFYGTNPVYNRGQEWTAAIASAELSISFASNKEETATACQYVCPDNHYLESWGDAEPHNGLFQLSQPTITNVFNTRQAQVSLLTWAGALPQTDADPFAKKGILSQKFEAAPYYLYVVNNWKSQGIGADAWTKALEMGLISGTSAAGNTAYLGNAVALASEVSSKAGSGLEMAVYSGVGVRDGAHGNNPWLHEMPDPVSKVTWDNYVALPKSLAAELGIKERDTVNIKAGGVEYQNVPALVQPGQANGTVAMAVGYGRTAAGKVGGSVEKGFDTIGFNAFAMGGGVSSTLTGVEISKGEATYHLAQTQTHHSIEGRDIVRETTLGEYKKNPKAGNDKAATHVYTIWEKRDYRKDGSPNHLWGMAIDLNACTGCGSCVVSCSIENNVPVVGRDEIRLRREMHWIRIDRYYSFVSAEASMTREDDVKAADASNKGEYSHWENVQVIHQPMMCQHCAQAPCETVCPVLATTHSSEGLNQMTYNRCIGTKYCGNNCPYKVRRFNWFRYNDNDAFDFHFNNPLGKMVINPDVTVRTRGVMEKCSFCVQRIQEGKLKAKRDGKSPNDVQVETACQRACPSNAIVFGDLHNPESEISKLYRNERGFRVLDEINVQSSVTYMTKVRNTNA
ncbi:MAG: TAT-variant-translocated molybdopterin oxidoreductase [Bacteroidetes bacterium]|nr:TAT-variant-translocated molybdopterin oxidoreductase [Bacteroidota bacterium]MDA0943998.1 TAT-variant-translocated molybdopterin oxidoreductase [Bacteroidota bacterium]MDA1112209.1 TAT-variant-translocated molybdopterin oxidoreductase [Bacteroidota bacterium]